MQSRSDLTVRDIQKTRKIYIDNVQLIQISIKESIQALNENNIDTLRKSWEESRDFYFNELINSFETFMEQYEVLLKYDRSKRYFFIVDEIFPLLQSSIFFIETLNYPIILQAIQKDKVILQKYTLQPTIRFATNKLSYFRIRKRIQLHKYKNVLKQFE